MASALLRLPACLPACQGLPLLRRKSSSCVVNVPKLAASFCCFSSLYFVRFFCFAALGRATVSTCPNGCGAQRKIWSGCKPSTRSFRRKHTANSEQETQARHPAQPGNRPLTTRARRLGAFRTIPPTRVACTTARALSDPVTGTPTTITLATSRGGGSLRRVSGGEAENAEKDGRRMDSR